MYYTGGGTTQRNGRSRRNVQRQERPFFRCTKRSHTNINNTEWARVRAARRGGTGGLLPGTTDEDADRGEAGLGNRRGDDRPGSDRPLSAAGDVGITDRIDSDLGRLDAVSELGTENSPHPQQQKTYLTARRGHFALLHDKVASLPRRDCQGDVERRAEGKIKKHPERCFFICVYSVGQESEQN